MSVIVVEKISKHFEYYKKEEGIKNSIRNLFHRERLVKEAVKELSFSIEEGEIIGFLGPNGAGKTTTIKLLSGIIFPTEGKAEVLGYVPWERKNDFKKQMAVVMAQKNQLWWDLPANESILLNRYIYEIPKKEYERNLEELVEMFEVKDLLGVQVRRLSLGERMKFEIISSLIHKPKVVFLDEPTIGLDIVAQRDMRNFIRRYREEQKATIILTSHYMQDIEELCERTIIINQGEKVFDGKLSDVKQGGHKLVTFFMEESVFARDNIANWGEIKRQEKGQFTLAIAKAKMKDFLQMLIHQYDNTDFLVEEAPMEEKVIAFYKEGRGK